MQTPRLSLFGRMWVSQNVALLWHGVATTSDKKNGEPFEQSSKYEQEQWKRAILQHHGSTTGRWRLRCGWQGEDLDGNDSSVEDASDMDSNVEKCQIESLIKKYS